MKKYTIKYLVYSKVYDFNIRILIGTCLTWMAIPGL